MRRKSLGDVEAQANRCTACPLHKTRTQVVFGSGNQNAELMLIGEAPGREEDRMGEPFVGKAGNELNSLLASIGIERDTIYIANVVKCRPMYNRNPEDTEREKCRPYLLAQVRRICPRVVIALGQFAIRFFVDPDYMGQVGLHRKAGPFEWEGIMVVPTYHPAYILRQKDQRPKVVEDFKKAKELLCADCS